MAAAASTGKETTHVSFVCQRCYQPLKMDSSIYSLDADTKKELESSLYLHSKVMEMQYSYEDKTQNWYKNFSPPSDITQKVISSAKSNEKIEDGSSMDSLSYKVKVSTQLFDIMSGASDIDHPLCEECTDNLLDLLNDQLVSTENELEGYKNLLGKLESKDYMNDSLLDLDIERLEAEQAQLMKEISETEDAHNQIQEERKAMKIEDEKLTLQEEQHWREYCKHQKSLLDFEDEQLSVHNQLQYAKSQLEKLRKTNVFNSTFHIWHKGHFGTINNFRLGRLPTVPVEWPEINAAWGQTVLLLNSLAKKIGLTFQHYRLVPYGNQSYVECIDDKSKELPLYCTGGVRFFWDTKFDQAMVAFLDCLQQFKEEVEKGESKFYLPYRMEKGKIYDSSGSGNYSVKIQFNSEEHWTKALKFMLTNLKWGLAWVSSKFAEG
ncbi:beclin-1-like [Clytia hemisphaerica]|uniref:Beclin-1 n=1 Tax=Clytia hemisphaerica TaxID=252671 RepID=A0A7M5TS67_9CNID